jgi:hypothetical protein
LLPTVQKAGFSTLAAVLAGMLLISGVVGVLFAPRTRGRDLDETGTDDIGARRTESELQAA